MRRGFPVKGHIVYDDGSIYRVNEQEIISGDIGVDFSSVPTIKEHIANLKALIEEDKHVSTPSLTHKMSRMWRRTQKILSRRSLQPGNILPPQEKGVNTTTKRIRVKAPINKSLVSRR